MCVFDDSTGCPSGCSVNVPLGSSGERYHGGSSCSSGSGICTIDFWKDSSASYFGSPDGATVTASDPSVLKGAAGNAVYCSAACLASTTCRFAFFRYHTGACYLQGDSAVPGQHMITTWVGQNGLSEGGVTFRKYLDPPPPSPPTPPLPPPAPPPTPAPTSPGSSCWFFYPSGCSKDGISSHVWVRDWWGEANANADTLEGCTARQAAKRSWCGFEDIYGHFVQ